jgi:NAD-dependent SIR2 family protein deacetylase
MIAELKAMADRAEPTAFHRFLKTLDDQGKLFRVYTQVSAQYTLVQWHSQDADSPPQKNIDGLEEKAGLTYGLEEPEPAGGKRSRKRKRGGEEGDTASSPTKQKPPEQQQEQGLEPPSSSPPMASTPAPSESGHSVHSAYDNNNTAFPLPPPSSSPSCSSSLSAFPPSSSQVSIASTAATTVGGASSSSSAPNSPRKRGTMSQPTGPRVIPLHGSMRHMLCTKCRHKEEVSDHLATLSTGQAVACSVCVDVENARSALSERSRGVGLMKVGVVLYGETHDDGARVGSLAHRDLMGPRPDFLLVAGTSLKVPGTKRLVRELAKVIKPPGRKEGSVHVVYANREWPSPASEWRGIFDVWVKGDCQGFVREVGEWGEEEERKKMERVRKREERMLMAAATTTTTSKKAAATKKRASPATTTATTAKKTKTKGGRAASREQEQEEPAPSSAAAAPRPRGIKTKKSYWTYEPVVEHDFADDPLSPAASSSAESLDGPRVLRRRIKEQQQQQQQDAIGGYYDDPLRHADASLSPPPANADLSTSVWRQKLVEAGGGSSISQSGGGMRSFFTASKPGVGAAAGGGKKRKK